MVMDAIKKKNKMVDDKWHVYCLRLQISKNKVPISVVQKVFFSV